MNPIAMSVILLGLVGFFVISAVRRMRLLGVGAAADESRVDRVGERLERVWTFALFQKKMRYYLTAGLAHHLIFIGFGVLLLRTVMLWGRGFVPGESTRTFTFAAADNTQAVRYVVVFQDHALGRTGFEYHTAAVVTRK